MPATSPHSLLITPDLRRRLQQRYEEAQRLSAHSRPDFCRIHELLAECLRNDPGNILYLNALFANLRRRNAAGGESWWRKWWASKKPGIQHGGSIAAGGLTAEDSSVPSMEYAVLQKTPDLLWQRPRDVAQLRTAATAAARFDFDEVELRYLQAARELAADDTESLRMLARALTRQGRFEDALGPWFAVIALNSEDSEAERAIEDLRGAYGDARRVAASDLGHDAAALIRQAESLQDAGDFAAAESCLTQAQSASGGDLAVLALREELRMRQSEQRVAIAKRRAIHDAHPKAQQLVVRLAAEHNRLELEIFNARAERLPGDALARIEAALRLKRTGNFSGAIQRLDEALRLRPDDAAALIELGECWQHLRQFTKALAFYERAAEKVESSSSEFHKLAHYRSGVLAAALGHTDAARKHFRAVLVADAAYKDAGERLDKLSSN